MAFGHKSNCTCCFGNLPETIWATALNDGEAPEFQIVEEPAAEETTVVADYFSDEPAEESSATTLTQEPPSIIGEPLRQGNGGNSIGPLTEIIVLEGVYFESGSVEISSGFDYLNEVVTRLQNDDCERITLTGHTDEIGSEELNVVLSVERAKAVRDYLIGQGVNPDIIDVIGRGEEQPLSQTDLNANRRVEFNCAPA